MAQALSEEEFQRMQVPLTGEKTTGLGDKGAGKREVVPWVWAGVGWDGS